MARRKPSSPDPVPLDNDDRMRSLIEVSRETGIPMPTILRLRREHPDRVPSVPMGAAHFFPEGAIAELRALAEAEGARGGGPQVGSRGLFSLSRRRRESEREDRPASAPERTVSRPEPAPAAHALPKKAAPPRPRSAPTASDAALARRLEVLEARQRELTAELEGRGAAGSGGRSVARFPTS